MKKEKTLNSFAVSVVAALIANIALFVCLITQIVITNLLLYF